MNVLCVGGCGYIGALLVPQLLAEGHKVTVYDLQLFGDGHLPKDNQNLTIIKGDVRDVDDLYGAAVDQDAIIWLASVSNNAMYGVNYEFTHSVNTCLTYFPVKRFIYASSAAVADPTSDYAKDKIYCEEKLKGTKAIIVRSASVCGYSPRQRFDLTVNMMIHDAARKGVITVNGGLQKRSHVHIQDLCDFYKLLLTERDEFVCGQTFTVVADNLSVMATAREVVNVYVDRYIQIVTKPRSDNRSYVSSGDKALVIGFAPKRNVRDAIQDLKIKFDSGYWPDSLTNPIFQNICDLKPPL